MPELHATPPSQNEQVGLSDQGTVFELRMPNPKLRPPRGLQMCVRMLVAQVWTVTVVCLLQRDV
jgi:hypothetical protein